MDLITLQKDPNHHHLQNHQEKTQFQDCIYTQITKHQSKDKSKLHVQLYPVLTRPRKDSVKICEKRSFVDLFSTNQVKVKQIML